MKNKSMIFYIIGIIIIFVFICLFLGGKNYKETFSGSFSGKFITNDNDNDNDNTKMNNNYDNYNHFSRFSSTLTNGTTFYGKNGGSVLVTIQSDGKPSLKVTLDSNNSPMIFTPVSKETFTNMNMNDSSINKFTGPNGTTATVINLNGQQAIRINTSSGSHIFTTSESKSTSEYNPNYQIYNNTPNTYYGSTGDVYNASSFANNAYTSPITYYGPNGSTATVNSNGPNTLTVKLNNNTIEKTLKDYGLTVVVQTAPITTYDNKIFNLKNIIASYKPEFQKRVLLLAHWDSRHIADNDTKDENKG
jgi:hypothetical protein